MSARTAAIAADLAGARVRFLAGDGAGLRLDRLEADAEGDTISFEVAGWAGEFTMVVADPYPDGETAVYGPDDLELSLVGPLGRVLDILLEELRATSSSPAPCLEEQDDAKVEACCSGSVVELPSDLDREASARSGRSTRSAESGADSPHNWIVEERPLEPKLAGDVDSARAHFGADAVSVTDASESWRLRLRVDLVRRARTGACGEPIVDPTTANAWGFDPWLPITLELHLPACTYLPPAGMPRGRLVQKVWQAGFPKFALERQLLQILADFVANVTGRPLQVPCCLRERVAAAAGEELELLQKFVTKKVRLVAEAQREQEAGFLVHLVRYTQLRLQTVHEYCAICDQPFLLGPMFLRTVCSEELCAYQFAEFGDKITTAEGLNTQAEVVDLLVCMFMRAAQSNRRDLILDPYPVVHGGGDGRELVFNPKHKDWDKLSDCLKALLQVRKQYVHRLGAAWSTLTSRMSVEGAALVKWVVASNRSYLAPLQDDERIDAFNTPFQYLLISAPPDKERVFQRFKSQYGSCFAYHGSPAENWHSILRNGLKNASNTKLMTTGAAYGPGIYLATDSQTSLRYAMRAELLATAFASPTPQPPDMKRQRTGNRYVERAEGLVMLAVCEVVDHPKLAKHNGIWVAPLQDTVCTRFFLVYPSGPPPSSCPIAAVAPEILKTMDKLRAGQCGDRDRDRSAA